MAALVIHEEQPAFSRELYVMSLGSNCLTARFLGDAGARSFAGPFDWIFSR